MKNKTNTSTSHWRNEVLRLLKRNNGMVGGGGGDASSANQLTANTVLGNILTELKDDQALAVTSVTDSNGVIWFREVYVNQDTQTRSITYRDENDVAGLPSFPLISTSAPSGTPNDTRQLVTANGSIPAGAISYRITNLGPLGDGLNATSIVVDGDTIPATIEFVSGNSTEGSYAQINYVVNGNQLFIEYQTLT